MKKLLLLAGFLSIIWTAQAQSPVNYPYKNASVQGNVQAAEFGLGTAPLLADDTCSAGQYWIAPVLGSTNAWHQCANGTISTFGGNGQAFGCTGTGGNINCPGIVSAGASVTAPFISATGFPVWNNETGSATNNPFYVNSPSVSGTCSSGCAANQIFINSLSLSGGTHLVPAFQVYANAGGGSGGYTGLNTTLNLNRTTLNTGDTGYYVGEQVTAQGDANDNGVNGTPSGHLYGYSINARLTGNATFWDQLVGVEMDVAAFSGASVGDIIGQQIVQIGSLARGSRSNLGISLNDDTTSLGWDCGYCFGAYSGYNPMASTGTLIGTWAHAATVEGGTMGTVVNGIDFGGYTFTGNFLNSPNFHVSGAGQITSKSSLANQTGTLSAELTSSGDTFTGTGTDWTGSYNAGFTHAATGTTNLVDTTLAITSGSVYQVQVTVTGYSAGSFTITLGGQVSPAYAANGTYTFSPRASSTGQLTFTPTGSFVGTVGTISVKSISAIPAYYTLQDNTGASVLEIRSSTASFNNTFIGANSGVFNTSGIANVALGQSTLRFNTTGQSNTAQGSGALENNSTGSSNTAQGFNSLQSNTTGGNNTAQGGNALNSNTTGGNNTAQGLDALQNNTTGNQNSAQGELALASNTTGSLNTANGQQALQTLTTGNFNSAEGAFALQNLTTSSSNTGVGEQAGRFISDGSTANQTSSNSVYLGYLTEPLANADTNENIVGNTAVGHGSNTTTIGNTSVTQTWLAGVTLPIVIYSYAGTQLAACASGLQGGMAAVSDATALVPGTAYSVSAGAGADTVRVQCTLVSGTYAWQTM